MKKILESLILRMSESASEGAKDNADYIYC
jgi:hypothetical protein